jgi:hypothetical protein
MEDFCSIAHETAEIAHSGLNMLFIFTVLSIMV